MTTDFQMENERLPPAWIQVPGLVAAIGSLFLNFLQPNPVYAPKFEMAGMALAALCLGGIVASLFLWKAARVLAVAVLALYWVGVGAACFFILLSPAFVLVYYGVFIIPAFLIVGLCTAYARRGLKRAWWLGSVVGGFGCAFVVAIVLSAPSLKRTADQTRPWTRPTEPIVLGDDMLQLVKCSRQFATLHPGLGYPESLSQMGPDGTGCLPEALVTGNYKGFTIVYHAGMRNAHGRIDNFTVNAEQAAPHGQDFSTMSTDESGLIVYKYEGPHGKGIPLPYSPAEGAIGRLVDCLLSTSNQNWSNVPQSEQYFRKCLGDSYVFTSGRSGEVGAYAFAYGFEHNDSGAIEGFTGEIRPRIYGIGGIRSYLIMGNFNGPRSGSGPARGTPSFKVYVTPEDRPATSSDPLAQDCEISWVACIGRAQID